MPDNQTSKPTVTEGKPAPPLEAHPLESRPAPTRAKTASGRWLSID